MGNDVSAHDGNPLHYAANPLDYAVNPLVLGFFEFNHALVKLQSAGNEQIRLAELSNIARKATDEQAKMLAMRFGSVNFLLRILKDTLHGAAIGGSTVAPIVNVLCHLARDDTNKRLFMKEGAVPLLVEGAQAGLGNEDRKVEGFAQVSSCAEEGNGEAQGAASGQDKKDGRHVMLSYQWDNQAVVKELCKHLREQNFKVWMDVDNMEGSLPQAMAEAVENAFVVLICMSQKYKDSQACRQEASYAFDRKKDIIPLMMQKGFTANGWLGLIVAGKLFYDFSKAKPFDRVIKAVKNILLAKNTQQTENKGGTATTVPEHTAEKAEALPPTPQLAIDVNKLKAWTPSDVKDFLSKAGLDGSKVEQFTGSLLLRLYKMYKKDEGEFFRFVETSLKLDPFESDRLGQALDKLSSL